MDGIVASIFNRFRIRSFDAKTRFDDFFDLLVDACEKPSSCVFVFSSVFLFHVRV